MPPESGTYCFGDVRWPKRTDKDHGRKDPALSVSRE